MHLGHYCEMPQERKKSLRKGCARAILDTRQAAVIYALKRHRTSIDLGSEFGISPKAVRDIWKGKTWAHATGHLKNRVSTRRVPPMRSVAVQTSPDGSQMGPSTTGVQDDGTQRGLSATSVATQTGSAHCIDLELALPSHPFADILADDTRTNTGGLWDCSIY